MSTLASERGLVGTDWPGFAEVLDAARARGLAGDPVTRQRLAEVYTGEQLLRFLGYRGLPPEPRVDKHVPFRDLVFSSTTRASVGGSTRSPSSTRRRPEPDLEVEADR
jgi:hypothetical protein